MMGTTRETVSRLFSEFKKKQLLQLKRATLIIRNKPALENWCIPECVPVSSGGVVKCGLMPVQTSR